MQNTKVNAKAQIFTVVKITVMVLFWGGILLLWWKYRKEISVESITNFVPGNIAAAIIVMLLFFALKGVLITVYGGILYAASGILFPLPTALLKHRRHDSHDRRPLFHWKANRNKTAG